MRDLIRQISRANPLWGAPRIHDEIRKLGIVVSQATVARCMLRLSKALSPSWRSFLRNHMDGIAAIDMFIVATVTFQLLYVLVVLGHSRRKIIHLGVTRAIPPRPGSPIRSPKPFRGIARHAICCATAMPSMASRSAGAFG